MGYVESATWMVPALTVGTTATALWHGVRDDAGDLIDLECLASDEGFAAWLGRPLREIVGQRYSRLVPTGVADRLPVYLESVRSGEARRLTFERLVGPQRIIHAELRIAPCGSDLAFAQMWDVTDREEFIKSAQTAQENAELALDQLESALNTSPDGFAIYRVSRGEDGAVEQITIAFVNEAASLPTGRPSESWRGRSLEDWYPEAVETGLRDRIIRVVNSGVSERFSIETTSVRGWSGVFENILTPFGLDMALITWRTVAPEGSTDSGAISEVLGAVDPLTGLLTRGGFRRQAADVPSGGLLYVADIDGFSRLNAIVGQHGGDQVLADLAVALRTALPSEALLARMGPDEVAVELHAANGPESAEWVHRVVMAALRRTAVGLRLPRITASAGWLELDGMPFDSAITSVELAIQASRDAGGSRLTHFAPEVQTRALAGALESLDVLDGLALGQFTLVYQPIVHAVDGSSWGAESLVRWRHPDLGPLLPAEFLPAIERSGTIVQLGDWVMERVVSRLAMPDAPEQVTINVSGVQLAETNVAGSLARALERHGVSASRIVIEATESVMIPSSLDVMKQLGAIRTMGARVAIDDFGSGYSSAAYLDRLPVDLVKLDSTFLIGLIDDRRTRLLSAVSGLIHSIDAVSLAEGVETGEQWDLVKRAGIGLAQGYLFGRPSLLD